MADKVVIFTGSSNLDNTFNLKKAHYVIDILQTHIGRASTTSHGKSMYFTGIFQLDKVSTEYSSTPSSPLFLFNVVQHLLPHTPPVHAPPSSRQPDSLI